MQLDDRQGGREAPPSPSIVTDAPASIEWAFAIGRLFAARRVSQNNSRMPSFKPALKVG